MTRPAVLRDTASAAPAESPGDYRDLTDLQRVAPVRWARFLRATVGERSERVAATFGVTDRAARDWLAEVSGPRLPVVIRAITVYPEAFQAIVVEGRGAVRGLA